MLPISLTETHGFGSTAISVFFVLFYAALSLSQIIVGIVSDRIGRHGFLAGGMLMAAIGIGLVPFVSGLWAYIPLGLASIGLGMFCVASIAELNECVSDAFKGAISGSYYFFWGAGYMLGPVVFGAVASYAPWVAFMSLALAFAVYSLVFVFAGE